MRLTSLALIAIALLACSCPQGNQSAQSDSPQTAPPAKPAPRDTGEADGGIIVYHDPVLAKPLEAFDKQAFIVLGEELDFHPADLDQLPDALNNPDGPPPQIVIFGYAPALPGLVEQGVVVESTARTFAGDRLVLAEKEGAGFATQTLFDTYRLRFNKLGYLAESAALGKPSRQALVSDGLLKRIEDRTAEFPSLDELSGALQEGSVELAILPASFVSQSDTVRPVLIIGEDLHEDIRYIAAATPGNEDDPAVLSVLEILAEDAELQQLMVGYGLLSREAALIDN